jgi:hypothetical protein
MDNNIREGFNLILNVKIGFITGILLTLPFLVKGIKIKLND